MFDSAGVDGQALTALTPTQAIRDAAQRNRGSAALWPVRFLLDRVLPQGPAAPSQTSAGIPAAADADVQAASTVPRLNGSAAGTGAGTSRPAASGSASDSGARDGPFEGTQVSCELHNTQLMFPPPRSVR